MVPLRRVQENDERASKSIDDSETEAAEILAKYYETKKATKDIRYIQTCHIKSSQTNYTPFHHKCWGAQRIIYLMRKGRYQESCILNSLKDD